MIQSTDILLVVPEILLLSMACLTLVVDTFSQDTLRKVTYILSQLTLIILAILVVYLHTGTTRYAFGNSFISDDMSVALKVIICIISFIVFIYSYEYLKKHEWGKGEYFVLGLFAVLGMMVMVSAHSLLTVYLGLELLSLSLYSMVAMHRDSQTASEAAIKYFVLGALASGILLYGISIFYGVTGTFEFTRLTEQIAIHSDQNFLLVFGLAFIIVGISFKLGAVPFHMWIPDVYHGAPTAVTLFISSAPKIAAFAMAIRLLVNGMQPLLIDWQQMLIILAVLSMATGNIIAIAQSNLKRMLAYSTIAHIGFLLLGILSGSGKGFAASMFYVITYAIMSTGSFGMIILLSRKGFESDMLDDMKGLADKNPWFAFIMLILMFSLAGVPPFVGFWAKWFVLKELVAVDMVWLAAVAVVFSIIGAYYYLRIIKLMYFDKADNMTAIRASRQMRFVLSLNGMAILIIGLVPGSLMSLCVSALVQ
jgi:NADH-quinone oxidoreductase subunit N